jgi:hypothetical protein
MRKSNFENNFLSFDSIITKLGASKDLNGLHICSKFGAKERKTALRAKP